MNKYEILKKYYGYDLFREGQEELIDSILSGRDTFGVMPTGAGKSVCFQVPALMLPGITLVISPLISLMKDQVGTLNQMGVHAAYLNSSLTSNQYRLALQYAKEGRYKIIYVAPERLLTEEFMEFSRQAKISMVSIDEAHCVSQWGQDFRPSYLKITSFIEQLSTRPIISAFTATATKEVKEDVIRLLQLKNAMVVSTGFDRKNLFFSVRTSKDKYKEVLNLLVEHPGESGIIYCATRKSVEEVCSNLEREGYLVTQYHAGLSDVERRNNQDDFIFDVKPIMVATNAFGMGIDKSNVKFVIHYNMPKNMESYYQEAGRAGRDGERAECILLYAPQDVVTNQFFIENNRENEELNGEMLEVIKERDRERLKQMTFYCFTNDCLRNYMLHYFGEQSEVFCGNCSNCLTEFETVDVTEISKNLIGCILECRERYGITVILDILRGSKSAKLQKNRLDSNSFYGKHEEVTIPRLRQILNHLILNQYLYLTNDEYPVLKVLEKAESIHKGEEQIRLKLSKERVISKAEKKEKTKKEAKNKGSALASANQSLFEELRKLRMEIAKKEKMPPYIIFTDKTLLQMSTLIPTTKGEMLEVSGVGENKFEKYGKEFIGKINEYLRANQINMDSSIE